VDIYFHASPNQRLSYRGQWTFTYDHLNRLKSHTNTNASNARVNLWYNALGQVWQRWTDTSGTMDGTLTRYVYDGGMLVQEHHYTVANVSGSWAYTYGYLSRDYLMQPGGIRQKESSDGSTFTDRFLITDGGVITTQIDRQTSTTIKRIELSASGDRQAGGSQQDGKLSNLWSVGSYLEGYGGGLSGATGGFDPLVQAGRRPFMPAKARFGNRRGNNAYIGDPKMLTHSSLLRTKKTPEKATGSPPTSEYGDPCDHDWQTWLLWSYGIYKNIGLPTPEGGAEEWALCTVGLSKLLAGYLVTVATLPFTDWMPTPPPKGLPEPPPDSPCLAIQKIVCCCAKTFKDKVTPGTTVDQSVDSTGPFDAGGGCQCSFECMLETVTSHISRTITEKCPFPSPGSHDYPIPHVDWDLFAKCCSQYAKEIDITTYTPFIKMTISPPTQQCKTYCETFYSVGGWEIDGFINDCAARRDSDISIEWADCEYE
jgi:hypothetical protein